MILSFAAYTLLIIGFVSLSVGITVTACCAKSMHAQALARVLADGGGNLVVGAAALLAVVLGRLLTARARQTTISKQAAIALGQRLLEVLREIQGWEPDQVCGDHIARLLGEIEVVQFVPPARAPVESLESIRVALAEWGTKLLSAERQQRVTAAVRLAISKLDAHVTSTHRRRKPPLGRHYKFLPNPLMASAWLAQPDPRLLRKYRRVTYGAGESYVDGSHRS